MHINPTKLCSAIALALLLNTNSPLAAPAQQSKVFEAPGIKISTREVKVREYGALCVKLQVENTSKKAVLDFSSFELNFPRKAASTNDNVATLRASAGDILPGESKDYEKCTYRSAKAYDQWTGKVVISSVITKWTTTRSQALRFFLSELDRWSNARPTAKERAERGDTLLNFRSQNLLRVCARGTKAIQALGAPETPEIRELIEATSELKIRETWERMESDRLKIFAEPLRNA